MATPEAGPVGANATSAAVSGLVDALERLAAIARHQPEVRLALESLGQALLALVPPNAAAVEVTSSPSQDQVQDPLPGPPADLLDIIRASIRGLGIPTDPAPEGPQPEPVQAAPVAAAPSASGPAVVTARGTRLQIDELRELAAAFRRKQHAADWAASQRAAATAALPLLPPEIRDGLDDSQVWFCDSQTLHQRRERDYRVLAAAFGACADALDCVDLVSQTAGESALFQPVQWLAEAQSMVRAASDAVRTAPDPDQERTHLLLRRVTHDLQIYVAKYMKLDEVADPRRAPGLAAEIAVVSTPIIEARRRERETRDARAFLDYHLEVLAETADAVPERHWDEIMGAIETLVGGGALRPSDRNLREKLLPLLDTRPPSTTIGPGMTQVLREIDRFLASQERPEESAVQATRLSPDVGRVAQVFKGRSVVLIGGERRVVHEERLENAFGLSELIWIEGFGRSYTSFEPHIARDDVVAVLLAVRWASHESGNVQRYCDEYGKPLIMLRAGYNENQVAAQVIAQAGQRLGI
jgi:hypothetical protein